MSRPSKIAKRRQERRTTQYIPATFPKSSDPATVTEIPIHVKIGDKASKDSAPRSFGSLRLHQDVRERIYKFLLFVQGDGSLRIKIDSVRQNTNGSAAPYSRIFADGSAQLVAVLAANTQVRFAMYTSDRHRLRHSQINKEARCVLHVQPQLFLSPSVLLDFLAELQLNLLPLSRHVRVGHLVEGGPQRAQAALRLLADAKDRECLHIEHGVAKDGNSVKAALGF